MFKLIGKEMNVILGAQTILIWTYDIVCNISYQCIQVVEKTVNSYYKGKKKYVYTVKPAISGHSKRRPKIGFQERLSLNAGQKYCRMLQESISAVLLTFIKLPFVFKTFVLSIF